MKRREFTLSLGAAAVLTACGGGGGGGDAGPAAPVGDPSPAPVPGSPTPAPAAPLQLQFALGTNLASMELGDAIRFGGSTLPNVNFTVPRQQDIDYLRDSGFTKTRLPIRWEMLQPVLFDSNPNAATRAILGNPGEFHPGYADYITQVLDAHANAGIKCIIDVHNYCRYSDFVYQPDGSIIGLTKSNSPQVHPFTTDAKQVRGRIMALANGATLTIAHYVDFMTRIAQKWKGHPGLAGYGMMNEPNALPKPGSIIENDPTLSPEFNGQDLSIWPTFAQAGVKAIRTIDPETPIYLGGNNFSRAWGLGTENPGWPLDAANIVYEVHCYLDATNSGQGANWNLQEATNFAAGVPGGNSAPIDAQTGAQRLQQALDFALPRKMALALTETGMAGDDPRWQESWENMLKLAKANNVEVFSWAGGSHWQHRATHVTNIPTWHQNRPVQSQQAGAMMAVKGKFDARPTIFDAGEGWSFTKATPPAPKPVTVTVYARGALQQPITLTVTSDNGGTFQVGSVTSSTTATLEIPAGANGAVTYTFTPTPNKVTTLTYTSTSATASLPPARKVYSFADPLAAPTPTDRAMAVLAKYSAAKWDMRDGYTDPLTGTPSADGQEIRAVSDSGYGSSAGNELEMLNWFNTDPSMGLFTVPVMTTQNAHKAADLTVPPGLPVRIPFGLWCRKRQPIPNTPATRFTADPTPKEVVPYSLADEHFAVAAIMVPPPTPANPTSGYVLQAGSTNFSFFSGLELVDGKPQARWVLDDPAAPRQIISSTTALAPNVPTTVAFVSDGSTQTLRVGSTATSKTAALTGLQTQYDQIVLGSGFNDNFPRPGFGGYLFAAITGRGAPTPQEMAALEAFLLAP